MQDSLDLIYNPLRLKLRGGLGWNLGGFAANATVNYIGDYINNLSPVVPDDRRSGADHRPDAARRRPVRPLRQPPRRR